MCNEGTFAKRIYVHSGPYNCIWNFRSQNHDFKVIFLATASSYKDWLHQIRSTCVTKAHLKIDICGMDSGPYNCIWKLYLVQCAAWWACMYIPSQCFSSRNVKVSTTCTHNLWPTYRLVKSSYFGQMLVWPIFLSIDQLLTMDLMSTRACSLLRDYP